EVRVPVAVAPVHRQVQPVRREVLAHRVEQLPALRVDRGHAAEVVVVLGDGEQPLLGYAPAPGHVAQERQHVVRALGPAEGDQQERVVPHVRHPARGTRRRRVPPRRWWPGTTRTAAPGSPAPPVPGRSGSSPAVPAAPTRPRTARSRGSTWPPWCAAGRPTPGWRGSPCVP